MCPSKTGIPSWRRVWRLTVLIAAVFALALAVLYYAPEIRDYEEYGYAGILLANVLGNGTIVIPMPSSAVNFSMGAVLDWRLVGLVGGLGAALGETVGYFAGLGGAQVIEYDPDRSRLRPWLERRGMLTMFMLSAIPNPLTDVACIWAGMHRYSFARFMLAVWLGKSLKALAFAWSGSHSFLWFLTLAQ
jgi:uncharacterized membrane protein YdjX (TVP38/TMEM64 family)